MAKYLVNIDLDNNQLQNAALHPVGTAPASPVEGQVYFDTTPGDKKMYYWDGSSWVFMGAQGTGVVDSVDVNGSTFINVADSGTAADPIFTVSLSATGTPDSTKFLRGDNSWAVPAYYTDADVDAHLNTGTATSNQILSWTGTDYDWIDNQVGDITEVIAGTYLSGGGSSGSVTLNHDSTSRTDTTSTASPAHGGTFTAVDSVTTNATGHVTAINVKTVTLPADDDTTYDLSGFGSTNGTAGIQLVGSDATTDQVDINGSGTTTVTHAANVITITSNDQYTGTVTSVGTGNSTFISGSGGPITSSGSLTYSLSATGTPDSTKYLRGDNTWSPVSGIYSWDIAGDTGSETILNTNTVTFAGGTNVTTAYDTGTNTLTINSTDQYVGTVTSVGLSMPSAFTVTNSPVTSSGTLTVTGAGTTSQYIDGTGGLQTFPTNDNYQYWTLSDGSTSTNITSTATATFQGTANEVEVAESSGTITIGLPNNVTITGDLTVGGGDIILSGTGRIQGVDTVSAGTDAVNKNYVDNAVVGNLVYQGGYNAATNTPDLDSSPSASIKKGWTYTVTADGLFFTEQVRVGDVLIAEVDAPTALTDWTTVQNNIDLASASQVGIGNVAAGEGIDVSYSNGTATVSGEDSSATNKGIVIVSAGSGISVSYSSGTATVTNTDSNSANTATGTITAGNTSGTVSHSFGINTMVQTIDSSGNTVYCDIARTTTSVTASIAAAQAGNITILVQKIG